MSLPIPILILFVYRFLGNSGLKVSVLSYGTWITAEDEKAEGDITDCVKQCFAQGINFFDTAEIYGFGTAEQILGRALKALDCDREDLVISTKLWQIGFAPNDKMSSRKHLVESMRNSLKNLQLEYVDIVFCHRPDYQTPLEETCRAMDWIIEEGYAFYWATSEWPADMVNRAIEICQKNHLHKPIADQCQYNAFTRDNVEKDLRELYNEHGYGTTIWSPLAGGILSGKYNDGTTQEGQRYHNNKFTEGIFQSYFGEDKKEKTLEVLKGLADLAEEVGYTQAQLVLAWTIVNQDVSSCIFGATKVRQVEDNLKALELAAKWSSELEEKFENILGNTPELPMDFNSFQPHISRRKEQVDYHMVTSQKDSALEGLSLIHI